MSTPLFEEDEYTEFDTHDGMVDPHSNCCGYPPIGDTDLCFSCKEHVGGWYDAADFG